MKIKFTKEHYNKMCNLLVAMLLENDIVNTKMGSQLNVVELLHTTTISTLNSIRASIGKQIEELENQDEWVATEVSQQKLDNLKNKKELVNLIIGYKRFVLEYEEEEKKRAELTAKLKSLKEAQKTPEDKIKEIEEELAGLNAETF